MFYLVQVVHILVTMSSASSSSSVLTPLSSAKRTLMKIRPTVLTLALWSSSVSLMILSWKILKRVWESKHFLNQSPVLPLDKTTLGQNYTFGHDVKSFDGLYDDGH